MDPKAVWKLEDLKSAKAVENFKRRLANRSGKVLRIMAKNEDLKGRGESIRAKLYYQMEDLDEIINNFRTSFHGPYYGIHFNWEYTNRYYLFKFRKSGAGSTNYGP